MTYICVQEFDEFSVLEQSVDGARNGVMLTDTHEEFTESLPERVTLHYIHCLRLSVKIFCKCNVAYI